VADPEPGMELQVDYGRMGLIRAGDHKKVCHGLIFTACFSRHCFVWLCFSQTTEQTIAGFEAAWAYFEGVFPVVIPDNMSSVVTKADDINPRFNDTFIEYAQSRGFEIDAARVRHPQDKALSSHCTSWVGSNRVSLAAVLAPRWTAGHLVGDDSRHQVIMFAFLVQGLAHEEPVMVPLLDRRRAHAETCSRLAEVEEPFGPETVLTGSQPVLHPDVVHDARVESLGCA
jgi:hypothetical protein